MKKLCVYFAIFTLVLCVKAFAQSYTITPAIPHTSDSIKPGIALYKQGNYTGAIQSLEAVFESGEKSLLGKYYLALCYTRLGMKDEAQKLYKEVMEQNENMILTYYSKRAVECLDNQESAFCSPQAETKEIQKPDENDDIGQFLYSGKQIHPTAMDRIMREKLEIKLQEDEYMRKQQGLENKKTDLGAPTNEEIASALNTLSKIGINPFQQSQQFNFFDNNSFDYTDGLALGNNSESAKMLMYSQMLQQQNLLNSYGI